MKKILILVFIFFINLGMVLAQEAVFLPSQVGVVQTVKYVDGDDNITGVKQVVDIKLITGDNKNSFIQLDNVLTGNPYYDIKLKKGMRVILHVEDDNGDLIFSIADVKRSHALVWLSLIFAGLLVYIGKIKGINSLVSIVITCFLIINLLSPMIISGIEPVFATILICLVSTSITLILVGGVNRKSVSAILGCTLSLVFAGILSFLTVKLANLTGFASEQSVFLYSTYPDLNFIAITISTIILATLGAVMDVAISIASTINEIYTIDNSKSVKELFDSGMNVGRDIIGTMANTLILVYLGASMPFLLLTSNIDFQKFINLNQVVTEVSSALIGSCAIIICVPITAFIASRWVKNTTQKIDFSSIDV